jgi:hypothetical protein
LHSRTRVENLVIGGDDSEPTSLERLLFILSRHLRQRCSHGPLAHGWSLAFN